jgi:beta-N-acetylhexosaminidase
MRPMASSGGIGDPRARARLAALAASVGLLLALTLSVTPDGEGAPLASTLSNARLAGQRIISGFKGHNPPQALRRRIANGRLAGVVLFADNFGSKADARQLIRKLQSIKRPSGLRKPLLVMLDQEGGLVKRLPGPPRYSAEEMGQRGAGTARTEGAATARSLKHAGVNVDLAPVLDVARPGSAIGAEHRSFGTTARHVAHTAGAFADGLHSHGVVPTGKHFPGFGAAKTNTDAASQTIKVSKHALRSVDEAPYRRFAPGAGRMVMLSLATYPAFSHKPAAFSNSIATHQLRDRLGFEGVSITDSLEAAAARDFGGPQTVALAGAKAGVDLLLYSKPADAAAGARALKAALKSDRLARDDAVASAQRVLDLRAAAR